MRRSADFASVVRGGKRSRQGCLVVHHLPGLRSDSTPPLVGLVVSRAVGSSVTRHRVSRRLRGQLAERLQLLPDGTGTVVRALPDAGAADSATFGAALDRALLRMQVAS